MIDKIISAEKAVEGIQDGMTVDDGGISLCAAHKEVDVGIRALTGFANLTACRLAPLVKAI